MLDVLNSKPIPLLWQFLPTGEKESLTELQDPWIYEQRSFTCTWRNWAVCKETRGFWRTGTWHLTAHYHRALGPLASETPEKTISAAVSAPRPDLKGNLWACPTAVRARRAVQGGLDLVPAWAMDGLPECHRRSRCFMPSSPQLDNSLFLSSSVTWR